MNDRLALEFLMKYNKKAKMEAEEFVSSLIAENSDLENAKELVEYWKGQKFQAEMNIRILQTHGISAK